MPSGPGAVENVTARVILADDDTYTLEFFSIRGVNVKTISEHAMVYADNLAQLQAELRRGGHAPRERAVLQAEFDRLTSLARQGAGSPGSAGGGMTVHVDKIEVQTQATDARGIAESLRSEMQREQRVFSAHGNVGQR